LEQGTKIAAVVLAAGESKRFRSARSKLVHALGGRPMVDWLLGSLRELGAEPIVVVVGHGADAVRTACGRDVTFAVQHERKGTGHAVLAAREALAGFTGDVLVLNADLPFIATETLRRLVATHRSAASVLTLLTANVEDSKGWGRIVRARGSIAGIVEERDASAEEQRIREVNVGVYCVKKDVLFPLLERVTPDNAQGEIYLTDVVGRAVDAGIHIAGVAARESEVGQINSRKDLAFMEKRLRTEINVRWMEAGITLEDPDTAYIGPDVTIGRDTVIGPNVQLRGKTVIGESCRLDGSAFLTDTRLGDRVHLRFGVVATEAEIGNGCIIGPFANLRPATRLAEEVHIGDFVETKNAVVGPRTKANHLTYLGDTQIGADSNVGAGTITCNYDGFKKHRTVIGDRVQIGSNTQLVAPVTLADDVYVASGTTVRKDVAAGSLVFNTRQEMHRPGWVDAFRKRDKGTAAAPVAQPKRPARAAKKARRTKAVAKPLRGRPRAARRRPRSKS
jgi:bifunctional UDP-N-acetylglucosamine pyrophosphorylase/glucosamine-1-phosphate N-acetyltransferase